MVQHIIDSFEDTLIFTYFKVSVVPTVFTIKLSQLYCSELSNPSFSDEDVPIAPATTTKTGVFHIHLYQ